MPTTKNIRLIKITANGPGNKNPKSTPKIIIFCVIGVIIIAGILFLGCKIGFLPAGMCGNNNLDSNAIPLTPAPTETPLPLAAAPTLEIFPSCGLSLYAGTPACGSVFAGNPEFYCGADGTSIMTLNFTVSGEAAKKILEQQEQGIPVETDPAGICQWSKVEPTGIEGEYNATLQCFGAGGTNVQILEEIGGSSCELAPPCPTGYTLDTSQLSEGEFFCIKNEHIKGNINQHSQCGGGVEGSYLNSDKKCCETKPTTEMIFSCPNGKIVNGHNISCDVVSGELERYTLPSCQAPNQNSRPTDNSNDEPSSEPTACTPDPAGGGCP